MPSSSMLKMAAKDTPICAQPQKPLRELKSGHLLRYKKRLLNKDWRKEYIVLLSDSSLVCFKDGDRKAPSTRLVLKDAPQLIAYGQYTQAAPLRPSKLPAGYSEDQLMVFGEISKPKNVFIITVHWFLAEGPRDLQDWMKAVLTTLPAPPPPPYSEREEARSPQDSTGSPANFNAERKTTQERADRNVRAAGRSAPTTSTTSSQVKPNHSGRPGGSEAEEAALGIALNSGPSTGWGRGTGWDIQGYPTQFFCYFAAADACLADLRVPELAFDISTADVGSFSAGDSFGGDFGDLGGAVDFGGLL